MNRKVVVGMSGGVDSSVAAYLLKKQGYDVIGVTMQIWPKEDGCLHREQENVCGLQAVEDARRVAEKLQIPYYVMDFRETFQSQVIDYFVEEYLRGRTPNPCNICNRVVKWEALLQRARELGADTIATGHYARIKHLPNGRYAVSCSETARKDQTYALYNLTQEQLAHTMMPVGDYTKEEIRSIAKALELPVAEKKDSQDICFIPDGDYAGFIRAKAPERLMGPGDFVLTDGTVAGRHKGIIHYTIGQRKGLGIALGRPVFVCGIDVEKNRVILGEDEQVYTKTLRADHWNGMGVKQCRMGEEYSARIRYSHQGSKCRVTSLGQRDFELEFEQPVRAVTPGQAVVLYREDYVAGGGLIC